MGRYWLMKSEPDVFGIDDLEKVGTEPWDGVRNYQARNFMRDQMQVGDQVLFYHSNAKPPGVAGLAEVARDAYPDQTQFDPDSKYFDPKSNPDDPRWVHVDVRFVEKFDQVLPLDAIRANPALAEMKLVQRGQRLSVQPVEKSEWDEVLRMVRSGDVHAPAPPARRKGGKKRAK